MGYIRKAETRDISRIAEILVFTMRTSYRPIFHNDAVSFGRLQVLPLAEAITDGRMPINEFWVYDDGIVKGLIRMEGTELDKLYVDTFFQGEGIGGMLIDFAADELGADFLWVLEKNERAIAFYERHGFIRTGEREPEEGTPEFIIKMAKRSGDI